MCDAVGVGIAVGVLSGVANASAAETETNYQNAVAEQKYLTAQRKSERDNQTRSQEYQDQLRIAGRKSEVNAKDFELQLKAYEEALNANVRQSQINAISANLANAQIGVKARTANAKAAFKFEEALVKMIQAQGQTLATGGSGQSFLLQNQQAERVFGMSSSKLDELLSYETLGFGLEHQAVGMDLFSADVQAYNNIPPPPIAQQAPLLPYIPIMDPGPPEPIKRETNYLAAFLGGAASGVSAYGSAEDF